MSLVTDADIKLQYEVERFIYREAYLLDTRAFGEWLTLYRDDAEYLIPAWIDETTLATDPNRELFLIYFPNKTGLDDRVYRINTRDSYASTPMPRSVHTISNVLILASTADSVDVTCSWIVHQYADRKGPRDHGGRYHYTLKRDDAGAFQIARKHITFLNDRVDIPIDIYNV
jgi:benzoate/toluate 1,2-dioxygenase beta subunit